MKSIAVTYNPWTMHKVMHYTFTLYYTHSEYSTQSGWTPLMAASFEGHVEVMRQLIEAKAEINTQKKV